MRRLTAYTLFLLTCIVAISCLQRDDFPIAKEYPVVITNPAKGINSEGVILSAKLIGKGTTEIIDYGFILRDAQQEFRYSIASEVTIEEFEIKVTGDLIKNTEYTYKAYVETKDFMVYSNEETFISQGSMAPVITDFSPKQANLLSEVTIYGNNFSRSYKRNTVSINGINCTVVASAKDSIVFITPFLQGAFPITVQVAGKQATSEEELSVFMPQITSLSETNGYAGDTLTIYGDQLTLMNFTLEVYLGSYSATIISATNDSVTVLVPIPRYHLTEDYRSAVSVKLGLFTLTNSLQYQINKSWEEKTTPPINSQWDIATSSGKKGYVLVADAKELLEYDEPLDTWSLLSPFPGMKSKKSIFTATDSKLFVLGGDSLNIPVRQFWIYDIAGDFWIEKPDIPFEFSFATSFRIDNNIYIITNNGEVWKYNIDNENFSQGNYFPGEILRFVFSFVQNDNVFLIADGHTWSYDLFDDTWTRTSANQLVYNNFSPIGLGPNTATYVLTDGINLYSYDLRKDEWIMVSVYPGCGATYSNKIAFVIDDIAYFASVYFNAYSTNCNPMMYAFRN